MIAIAVERVEELRERLSREFEFLRDEGVEVQMRTVRRGEVTFVGCDPVSRKPLSPELNRRFRLLAANAVADLIVNRLETAFLRRLVRTHYGYFDAAEQDLICAQAELTLHPRAAEAETLPQRIRRKGRILARLTEYLEKNSELVVDGFVTFRLKDYVEEMEEAVDQAVEEYLMEKEQQEFIQMLRYFVTSQEPRAGLVNVMFDPGGGFDLVSSGGSQMGAAQIEALGLDEAQGPADQEETLISTLLALVPGIITVHRSPHAEAGILDLLRAIFDDRLIVCNGCHVCQQASQGHPHE